MYVRYFWQGNHQIYGHIRGVYTVLANPTELMKVEACENDLDGTVVDLGWCV